MLIDTPPARMKRGRRHLPAAGREIAVFAAAYLTYFGVRALTEGAPWRAFANASAVLRFENVLGIDWEAAVQSVVLRSRILIDAANAVYIYGHWPVLIGAGVLLYRYRPESYYRLRNVCLGERALSEFFQIRPRLTSVAVRSAGTRGFY